MVFFVMPCFVVPIVADKLLGHHSNELFGIGSYHFANRMKAREGEK
jgi:hypothetical protein